MPTISATLPYQMFEVYGPRAPQRDRARAADELEQYLRETPNANNLEAIRAAIKKLRELAGRS